MTVDESMQDAARMPGDRGPASARSAPTAATKKVAKKVRQKAPAKKAVATTRKTAKKVGRTTTRAEEPAAAAPASASKPASGRRGAGSQSSRASIDSVPAPNRVSGSKAASERPVEEAAPSVDAPRPPAPLHPGATMDTEQERAGGIGGMLALWGPLIIVAFLVLVFRGAGEREGEVVADASMPAAGERTVQPEGVAGPAPGPPRLGQASGRAATYAAGDGLDRVAYPRGRQMNSSMAGTPDLVRGGAGALMDANASRGAFPPPPGPYRNPWAPALPAGQGWRTETARDWRWQAEARDGQRYARGGESPTQWVRCARPYYWCPAPTSPAW